MPNSLISQTPMRNTLLDLYGLRPFNRAVDKPRPNRDGSSSTELTRTVMIGDGWVNVPSLLWNSRGSVDAGGLSDDQLAMIARTYEQSGQARFKRFASVEDAVRAARARSAAGGANAAGSR